MAKYGEFTKGGATSAIKFVVTLLSDAKQRFAPLATSEEPSQALIQILDVSLRVTKDLQAVVEKSGYPTKDSAEVKKWQADFSAEYARANTLLTTAKTIPGTAANGILLIADTADPSQQTGQMIPKSAQAPAVLEAAKNRLTTVAQMFKTTQDNYVKANDTLSQQQNKLADIQAHLTRLTASDISLAEIKQTLIECIKVIIYMKDQITSLVRFFKAITLQLLVNDTSMFQQQCQRGDSR